MLRVDTSSRNRHTISLWSCMGLSFLSAYRRCLSIAPFLPPELTSRVDANSHTGHTRSLWIPMRLTLIPAFLCYLPTTRAHPGGPQSSAFIFCVFSFTFQPLPFTFGFLLLTSYHPHPTHLPLSVLTLHLLSQHALRFLTFILTFPFHTSFIFIYLCVHHRRRLPWLLPPPRPVQTTRFPPLLLLRSRRPPESVLLLSSSTSCPLLLVVLPLLTLPSRTTLSMARYGSPNILLRQL
jgi:hypothetical protein